MRNLCAVSTMLSELRQPLLIDAMVSAGKQIEFVATDVTPDVTPVTDATSMTATRIAAVIAMAPDATGARLMLLLLPLLLACAVVGAVAGTATEVPPGESKGPPIVLLQCVIPCAPGTWYQVPGTGICYNCRNKSTLIPSNLSPFSHSARKDEVR